ncbi:hypothetical protein LTR27_002138 [Elasticomyces elasticus]|nr:hypothetical protein LTR27_002138 [Elasticomyces elasticus]
MSTYPEHVEKVELAIICGRWRQVGPATKLYEKPDGTSILYRFRSKWWFTLDKWLPPSVLQLLSPAWSLPRQFVVKMKKPFEDVYMQPVITREREGLQSLCDFQGHLVPRLLPVQVEGIERSSLAIELLAGDDLWELSKPGSTPLSPWCVGEVCRGITRCFEDTTKHGIVHYDPELTNIMLVQRSWKQIMPAVVDCCLGVVSLVCCDLRADVQRAIVALLLATLLYTAWMYWKSFRVVLIDFEDWVRVEDPEHCKIQNETELYRLCKLFRNRCFYNQTIQGRALEAARLDALYEERTAEMWQYYGRC